MNVTAMQAWPARARLLFPGVLACAVVAAAATFLSQHYGAPVMLFALMGTTLAWVFERLSSDVPFMPHEGVSSSGGVSSAGQAG